VFQDDEWDDKRGWKNLPITPMLIVSGTVSDFLF
jgi:hypothetical protein